MAVGMTFFWTAGGHYAFSLVRQGGLATTEYPASGATPAGGLLPTLSASVASKEDQAIAVCVWSRSGMVGYCVLLARAVHVGDIFDPNGVEAGERGRTDGLPVWLAGACGDLAVETDFPGWPAMAIPASKVAYDLRIQISQPRGLGAPTGPSH